MGLQGTSIFTAVNNTAYSHLVPVFATGTLYGDEKYCLIKGTKKMIVTTDSKGGKWNLIGYRNDNKCELYNTSNDMDERDTLICAYDEEGQSMKKDLELFVGMTTDFQRGNEVSEVVLDRTLKERLGSLGYLE